MRYAYATTAALLLTGSALTLFTGFPAGAQSGINASTQASLAPRGAPTSFADLTEQLQPAVVNIATKQKVQVATSFNPLTGERRPVTEEQASGGSGFVISADGYIVTNNHVIAGGNAGEAADEITVTFTNGKEYKAKLVGRDPTSDLALLKIAATDLPFVEMVEKSTSRVGDWVIAIGNPLGLGSTVTAGIVSALQRNIGAGGAYDRFIQTDTAINRGNSGGPLFDLNGKVIGINNRLISPVGANIGIGFAIPAEEAVPVIEALKKGERPERGYLGISIRPVDEGLADALGLDKNKGEFVALVRENEPGAQAGLKQGDIVLKVNGLEVSPEQTLSYIVANIKPGTKIPIDILREGKPMKITATVGARPSDQELAQSNFNPDEEKDIDTAPSTGSEGKILAESMGISVIPMTAELARQLGMPTDSTGLIIDAVGSAGGAARSGLRRADVIVSATYKDVKTPADLVKQVEEAKKAGRSNILLGVRRRGAPVAYVTVKLN
ncbi:protease [Sphingorhabdus lutea]|uniref:Probable periplasmic serine endoprotease DegP-like n=1 Tax=Sphingorhabdus lutea TaxID=1913578 RepID=A0A1L3JEJ1_9SPHN|nr:trypsin-like peptidase domain-containing protein [Sphingorhabdus lutea]APG63557.1 protease [Sphingorhabdus lutea]